VALLASAIPLIFTDETIFFFHFIFVLLTIGAFFWDFRAFAIRAGIWVMVVVAILLFKILAGDIPAEELSEIPLLTMMLVVAFAISRQRGRAQDALRGERDTLNTIMENTQAHLAYLDPEFNFVGVNSAYVKGSGHSREELLGHNHFLLFPDPENQAIFEGVRDTGQPVEFRAKPFEYPDQPERGVTYWDWTLAPVTNEAGQVGGLVLSLLDVTERKQMEEALRAARDELELRVQERTAALAATNQALLTEISEREQTQQTLRESEERYRRLVELSFEAIVIHTGGKLVYVNPQAVKLLEGGSPEEFIGRPIRDFVHPDYWDAVQARVQRVGEEGWGAPLVEEKLIRLDGTSVDVEAASVRIRYQGRPAVQSVIHDISPRKRAEAERERERIRIAHDLHDSLGHSLGYLHLKLDEMASARAFSENAEVRRELGQMRDVTNQAYEVVRGMLAASLPQTSIDLATALLVQARSVGQRAGFEVQLGTEGEPRSLSPIVQQQLLYLFQEALVNVERHACARQVDINLAWGEDTLTISFSDDGQGLDPEKVRADGHFGLAIMQERAQEINGQLSLTSVPNAGTQLVLRLPLETASQARPPDSDPRGGSYR
jgi:PAS domain S-box-containing protein